MAVRDTLNKIENLVASASHLPLTKKALIDEEDLLHLIEEFRNELPQELGHAEEIIQNSTEIIRNAEKEAQKIVDQAKKDAMKLVDENDVVTKALNKARIIETQANQKANEIVMAANNQARQFQDSVNQYANQVFDQLIVSVTGVFNTTQNLESGLKQSLQVLQQSKMALNQQAYNRSQAQTQEYPQNPQNPQS